MAGERVVVGVSHADGTAGVLESTDGTLWLTGYVEDGPGTMLDTVRGAIEGLLEDKSVQAGVLPDRVAAVELLLPSGDRQQATVGDRAWIAVVEEDLYGPLPVQFFDSDGTMVRPPLPADWPREPVDDAVEPCTVCGATGWEKITPLDHSRGSTGASLEELRPSPIAVCVSCGHEIGCGGWYSAVLTEIDGDELAKVRARNREAQRESQRQTLARMSIPAYVLAGWDGPMQLGGFGESNGAMTSVRVEHGDDSGTPWALVEHDAAGDHWASDEGAVRERIEYLLHDSREFPGGRSPAAMSVWMEHRDQTAARAVRQLALENTTVIVEGRGHPAVMCRHGDVAAYALKVARGRILVLTRGLEAEGLALTVLADPMVLADAPDV